MSLTKVTFSVLKQNSFRSTYFEIVNKYYYGIPLLRENYFPSHISK